MTDSIVTAGVFLCLTTLLSLAAQSSAYASALEIRFLSTRSIAIFGLALTMVLLLPMSTGSALPIVIPLACAVVCTISDLASGYVFDRVTLPGIFGTVVAASVIGRGEASIAGLLCGFTLMGLLWLITHRRGLGLGDVKLAAVLGAAGNMEQVLVVLSGAFVVGAMIACVGLASGRLNRGSRLPFAPCLASAFAFVTAVTSFYA